MGARRKAWIVACFLLPNFLGFVVFTAGPVVFSLGASLTNWNLQRTTPTRYVGLANYVELSRDDQFWTYLVNTAYFMIGMPFAIAGSLFLAVLLNQRLRFTTTFRTVLYVPAFTSGVALMILWKALYNPDFGPINAVIEAVLRTIGLGGLEAPQWLLSTRNLFGLDVERLGVVREQFGLGARDALIFMGIWTGVGGGNMLLYLAALSNVPSELTEAAALDGASRWECFRNVTWPQLSPTTFFIVVMSYIGGLQGGFEQARVMTAGGPAGTTTTLAYYIYTKAFEEFQIGYASAVAWVLFGVIFVVTVLNWRFGNRETNLL
ncbi:MAG: sugar ABC transporter permease [Fimbriimonadaceae bacterium]|nr:sugar ABC transporter permease [Fimbriimonadaceae bacterium]